MEQVLLVRYGELHLKGLNRPFFERKLIGAIKKTLHGMGADIRRDQGRFLIYSLNKSDIPIAMERLSKVFGIYSISHAIATEKEWGSICQVAKELMTETLEAINTPTPTFKVYSRRSDKRFEKNSEAINRQLGQFMLETFQNLKVDVHKPLIKLCVEIREKAFIYANELMAVGGMPSGTAGRAALLISGGIDSPVAGFMLAKRGMDLSAVHFFSYPYTSVRARDKVVELARIVSQYSGTIRLHLVPFTKIQMEIYENCPEKETTILMRRLMMRISERIARADGALALITGEALGQVASQTLNSLCVTDDAVNMPVFRPLIGFDKEEIVRIAKRIGTFETSILPYEDCCTVFVPKHPVTMPDVDKLRQSESLLNFEGLIEEAIANTELIELNS